MLSPVRARLERLAPLFGVPIALGILVASGAIADPGRDPTEASPAVGEAAPPTETEAAERLDHVLEDVSDVPLPSEAASPSATANDGEAEAGEATHMPPPPGVVLPTRWMRSRGRQCRTYRGRSFCDGPLRVPQPHGAPADLATSLGLDRPSRASRVAMHEAAPQAWIDAVTGDRGRGLLWPVPLGRQTRGYGRQHTIVRGEDGRLHRGDRIRLHPGIDIGARGGSHIRAVDDGLVIYSFNSMRGYGNAVVLLHADRTTTLYAHCRAAYVFAGQQVRRGQVIGEVGHTGLAHGDHLHFEWRRDGQPLNPTPHFVETPSPEPTAGSNESP